MYFLSRSLCRPFSAAQHLRFLEHTSVVRVRSVVSLHSGRGFISCAIFCCFFSVLLFASLSPVASYLTKAPNFQVKLGLSKILLCLRFDSLINLLVRTKVENVLSHYLSNVVVVIVFVDPKVVNAVFMLACVRLCRILHILCSVGSSTSICLPFICTCRYIVCDSDARKDIPSTVREDTLKCVHANVERMEERWRARAQSPLFGRSQRTIRIHRRYTFM